MITLTKTDEVEQDLLEIWEYTTDHWGEAQAEKYLRTLDACFNKIQAGTAVLKLVADAVFSIRCEQHVIFVLSDKKKFTVIAVFHEKMNMLVRLKERLG